MTHRERLSSAKKFAPLHAPLLALAETYREDAARFASWGDPARAAMLEKVATEIRAAIAETDAAPLTLEQAAAESGYTADHLRHLVAAGALPNRGRRGAPRVARGDLPRRVRPTAAPASGRAAYSPEAHALALMAKETKPA